MKTLKLIFVLLFAGSLSVSAQKTDVKPAQSSVKWTATKIGGAHSGGISIQSGNILLKSGNITGGKIVIDMNSITNTDLEDPGYKQKLVGHLKSDDFFGVEKFPTAVFEVTKATAFKDGKATVTGTLTIKGKTETTQFEVVKKASTYTAQLKVDRSKYDVRYGSKSFFDDLGDKVIDDVFTLDIILVL